MENSADLIGYVVVFLLGLIAGVIVTLSTRKAVKKVKGGGGIPPKEENSKEEKDQ